MTENPFAFTWGAQERPARLSVVIGTAPGYEGVWWGHTCQAATPADLSAALLAADPPTRLAVLEKMPEWAEVHSHAELPQCPECDTQAIRLDDVERTWEAHGEVARWMQPHYRCPSCELGFTWGVDEHPGEVAIHSAKTRIIGKLVRRSEVTEAEVTRLTEELAEANRKLAREEAESEKLIEQRDRYHDAADELAYAIADESVIGEHTSANNPWERAKEALDAERKEAAKLAPLLALARDLLHEPHREINAWINSLQNVARNILGDEATLASGPSTDAGTDTASSDAVDDLASLVRDDFHMTYDSGRNITHPCTFCGRAIVPPSSHKLYRIGHYPNGDVIRRPVCEREGCRKVAEMWDGKLDAEQIDEDKWQAAEPDAKRVRNMVNGWGPGDIRCASSDLSLHATLNLFPDTAARVFRRQRDAILYYARELLEEIDEHHYSEVKHHAGHVEFEAKAMMLLVDAMHRVLRGEPDPDVDSPSGSADSSRLSRHDQEARPGSEGNAAPVPRTGEAGERDRGFPVATAGAAGGGAGAAEGAGRGAGHARAARSQTGLTDTAGIYDESIVAGAWMSKTIREHVRACEVFLQEEQERSNPDNALIGLLCDSVRMAREYCRNVAGVHHDPDFGVDPEDAAALLKLRQAIDTANLWPSEFAKDAGDYEAAVGFMAGAVARARAFEATRVATDNALAKAKAFRGRMGRTRWAQAEDGVDVVNEDAARVAMREFDRALESLASIGSDLPRTDSSTPQLTREELVEALREVAERWIIPNPNQLLRALADKLDRGEAVGI